MTNFSPFILMFIFISLLGLMTCSNDSVAADASNLKKSSVLSMQTEKARHFISTNMALVKVFSISKKPLNNLVNGVTTVSGGSMQSEQLGNSSNWQGVRVFTQSTPETIDGQSITLNMQNGKASGFSGCNTFNSRYTLNGQSLKFDSFVSTRRACVDDNLMSLERIFLKAIAMVDGYTLNNGILLLTAQNTPVIELKVV